MPSPPSSIGFCVEDSGDSKNLPLVAAIVDTSGDNSIESGAGAVPVLPVLAILPFRGKGSGKGGGKGALTPFRRKLFSDLGNKPIEESIAELQAALQGADAREEAAAALVAKKDVVLQEVQAEFDAANADVAAAIAQEVEAANAWQTLRTRWEQQRAEVDSSRVALLEVQQKLAMLEVMATNEKKMRLFEEQRQAAVAAAEEARRQLKEHKRSAMKASLDKLAPFKGAKRAGTAADVAEEEQAESNLQEATCALAADAAAEEPAGSQGQVAGADSHSGGSSLA